MAAIPRQRSVLSLYLDASLVVSALTREQSSTRVRDWLEAHANAELAISDWVVAEVASALAMKVRTQAMTEGEQEAALAAFAHLSRSFEVKAVSRRAFRSAALFCTSHARGLRAGDALHLAVCQEGGDTLCTLDRRLAASATALGVEVCLV